MAMMTRLAPEILVKEAIIAHLRGLCGGWSNPIPQTQIRGILDLSGTPKDAYGVVVACDNLGEHWGRNNGGILIDVRPRILVYTHLNEDIDGSLCGAIVSDTLMAMVGIEYALDGWDVAWNGNWTTGETSMMESYRQCELSATLPLVRLYR